MQTVQSVSLSMTYLVSFPVHCMNSYIKKKNKKKRQTGKKTGPLEVQLKVDGQCLPMELDTGAAVTLVSESTYRQLWPKYTV